MSKEPSVWDEDAFWRKLVLPQEDRSTPWEGKGYRWFRSPNVVPIEQWRRRGVTCVNNAVPADGGDI